MERKKKSALCNKVISLFTSLLMVLSTIIGYIPTSAVSVSAADSYPLQEISSGTKLSSLRKYNPKSDILINPTPDKISGYSTNDDFDKNKDGSLWKDKSGRYLRIRTKSGFATFDGKQWTVRKDQFHPTITYYKAGYDKKNKQYYNLTMRVEKYESDGYIWYMADSSTRDKQYSKITTKPECPYIYIDTKKSSVGISGLKNVQCSFTWSKWTEDNGSEDIAAGQVEKLTSYITIRDIDDGQAVKIAGNQKGDLDVYKLKGSKFITEQDGWYVSKSGETTSPSDKKSWVQALLTGSPTFIMWFRANEPNKVVHDTEYNKQWGMPANTCYSWTKNNAGMISGNYFEYTAESLINTDPIPEPTPTPGGDPEPNDPSIEKVVVQKGGSYDDAYKAASPEDAFEINDYDDYDYLIKTAGPGAETDSYEIVDTLEDCLTIDDTHHITITDKDFKTVSAVSIVAIFFIIFFVLKSISLPVILVAAIEFAIFVNMGIPYYTGTTIPFISSVVIGTIQLGATVDYAILMTTRYKRERAAGNSKKEAISIALGTSIPSIIVSALGFFAATFGVGMIASVDMIASLCTLMARGAIISMFVVIFVLPSLFVLLDRVIIHTSLGFKPKKNSQN